METSAEFIKSETPDFYNELCVDGVITRVCILMDKFAQQSPQPISEEEINALWTKHRGHYNVIFNRRDFGIFLREFNNG